MAPTAHPGPPPEAAMHSDPGLQPERTALAWERTLLSLVVVSLMFVRWLPHRGVITLLPAAVAVLAAAAILLAQRRRYARACRGLSRGSVAPAVVAVTATGVVVGLIGVFGLYAVWWG